MNFKKSGLDLYFWAKGGRRVAYQLARANVHFACSHGPRIGDR